MTNNLNNRKTTTDSNNSNSLATIKLNYLTSAQRQTTNEAQVIRSG